MNKITTEVRYKDMSFTPIRTVGELTMYFTKYADYVIIVNNNNEVLFEIEAEYNQGSGFAIDRTDD